MAGPLTRPRLRAAGLALPLVAFIGVTFVVPLATMLLRSVYDPVVADALPETVALLREWDGQSDPGEAVYAAAARELLQAREARTIGRVASRVNRIRGGLRSVLVRSGRLLLEVEAGPWRQALIDIDPDWGDPLTWHAIRTAGDRFTTRHYLNAVDLQRLPDGSIARQPPERRIYLALFWRTFVVSLGITALCLLLGYPVAYLIAHAPPGRAGLLLALVLVPFWTSLLVRTTSWIVLLQSQGVVNDVLVALGLIGDDGRLAMIYNMTGTMVAMTHVLLPFMVLPLYSVMRTIPPQQMRAAESLGAGFPLAFLRVYWPQSLAGVGAGSLLVFILAIGYYITPGAGGRPERAAHLELHRLPHADLAELGSGRRARRDPAGVRHRALSALRPRGRRRAHEAGMSLTDAASRFGAGRLAHRVACGLIFAFLVAPILVIVPLSFNAEPYFTFTEGMLRLDPEAYSLRWYRQVLGDGAWARGLANSLLIGVAATVLATALGTLAALGLSSRAMPARHLAMGLLISPMVTPLIISAAGMFFFYSTLGLSQTHLGLILAHAALGTPFVVITVTATLSAFDTNLTRAAASLGAGPVTTFRRVQLPLIAPGVVSGALFAFATSFDEVVVVLFMAGENQRTIPRQMWAGIREQISPAMLAVATFLILFAVLLLCTVEWLRRRAGRPAGA